MLFVQAPLSAREEYVSLRLQYVSLIIRSPVRPFKKKWLHGRDIERRMDLVKKVERMVQQMGFEKWWPIDYPKYGPYYKVLDWADDSKMVWKLELKQCLGLAVWPGAVHMVAECMVDAGITPAHFDLMYLTWELEEQRWRRMVGKVRKMARDIKKGIVPKKAAVMYF